jgi:hypothetical protein
MLETNTLAYITPYEIRPYSFIVQDLEIQYKSFCKTYKLQINISVKISQKSENSPGGPSPNFFCHKLYRKRYSI